MSLIYIFYSFNFKEMKRLLSAVLASVILVSTFNVGIAAAADCDISLASYPVSDTIVGGEDDVVLATFVVSEPGNQDVYVTDVVISGYIDTDGDGNYFKGSDNGYLFRNVVISVWLEDENGDQVGNLETFDSFGEATFNGLSWYVESGVTRELEVHGDISSTAPLGGYDANYVAVNIDDAATDFLAQDIYGNSLTVDGSEPNGDIDLYGPTVRMEVVESGELTMQESYPEQLQDQIAAANSEDLLVGVLRFNAQLEDFEVNRLTLTFTDETGDLAMAPDLVDCIESVTLLYPTDFDDPDTLDGMSTGFMAGDSVTFTSLGMAVPEDDYSVAEVYVDLEEHANDWGSLDSDDELYLTVDNTNGDFEAIGQVSGENFDENDYSDVTFSNATYVYRSVPTVANDTSLGSSIVLGIDQEVYRFTVSADSNERVVLKWFGFDVSSVGVDIGNPWFITEYGDITVLGAGRYNGYDFASVRLFSGEVVGAGTTKTYSLYAGQLYDEDPMVDDEAISVRLHHDESGHVPAGSFWEIRNAFSGLAGLIWSDGGSAYGHGLWADEWMSGYKVSGFPLDYMTLS